MRDELQLPKGVTFRHDQARRLFVLEMEYDEEHAQAFIESALYGSTVARKSAEQLDVTLDIARSVQALSDALVTKCGSGATAGAAAPAPDIAAVIAATKKIEQIGLDIHAALKARDTEKRQWLGFEAG